ncbi:hypothetical protein PHMEG_0002036 [Phytophthora megakarya]|uniref:Transmembrane protein 135 N-terminal domain-containing protein n=1 Tax=Phytophthora megakarya TaxID=4795 RepID=A0A225X1N2_9STRA|nr:hypothetical protein PHMEG_0002036 [Phytophthora megakarya]
MASLLPPRVPSTASNLHVTASDISLFSRSDEEDADDSEEDAMAEDEQLAVRTLVSEQQDGDEGETLGQELLEALRLGTSNFLLAYNTRAGIATLLRLLKLLQRRDWKAAVDLRQLLDEKHLNFRVDAVRLGLFLGWFTGGYRGLRALLPVILRRILPKKQLRDDKKVKEIAALASGAIAALALGFVDAKRLEMETLELVQQVNRGVPVSATTLQKLLDRKPGIPRDFLLPTDIRAFQKTFPLYLSLFIVPGVVIHFKRFLRSPFRTLARSTLNATRSNCFLASFVTLYLSLVCLHRRVVSKDHRFIYYLAGFGASSTILLEPKSRRSELALYVLPRALDSLAMILHDRGVCSGFKYGEVALFSASMSVMMYCYEHEKESMSPFLYSTMKRFMLTSTDKKKQYVASLEKKERRLSQSIPMAPASQST